MYQSLLRHNWREGVPCSPPYLTFLDLRLTATHPVGQLWLALINGRVSRKVMLKWCSSCETSHEASILLMKYVQAPPLWIFQHFVLFLKIHYLHICELISSSAVKWQDGRFQWWCWSYCRSLRFAISVPPECVLWWFPFKSFNEDRIDKRYQEGTVNYIVQLKTSSTLGLKEEHWRQWLPVFCTVWNTERNNDKINVGTQLCAGPHHSPSRHIVSYFVLHCLHSECKGYTQFDSEYQRGRHVLLLLFMSLRLNISFSEVTQSLRVLLSSSRHFQTMFRLYHFSGPSA